MFRQMFDGSADEGIGGGIWATLALLVAAVMIFGVGLLFHLFCEPAPSTFEQAVFYALIFLIFLETVYAGLYRSKE